MRRPTMPLRMLAVLLLALAATVVSAAPALAHGRGSDASNFLSEITDDGGVPGLSWRVVNSDEYLQLDNDTESEVLIPGYTGEPYLRIGPDGVFENQNSPAAYLNDSRFGEEIVPPNLGDEPRWAQLSTGSDWAWHDHRIHWMAQADPPQVATDPDAEHLVNEGWSVAFTIDGDAHQVVGDLRWIPGDNPLVWLLPALLVVSIPVLLGLRSAPDRAAGSWHGLSRPAGITLLALALANIANLIDDIVATPLPLSQLNWWAPLQTVFFIAVAVFGAWRAIQGEEGAFTALGVGAGAVFMGQGVLYLSVLSSSQTASVFPGWLTRSIVAASLAQIIPMAVAVVMGNRALLPEYDDGVDELAVEASSGS